MNRSDLDKHLGDSGEATVEQQRAAARVLARMAVDAGVDAEGLREVLQMVGVLPSPAPAAESRDVIGRSVRRRG